MMVAVQIIKAMNKKDTIAFEKLSNQCWGTPTLRMETPQNMIIQVVHDDSEIKSGLNSGLHPVP
jgi:hypothetical protein